MEYMEWDVPVRPQGAWICCHKRMNYLLKCEEKFRSLQSNATETRYSDGDSQQRQQGGGGLGLFDGPKVYM